MDNKCTGADGIVAFSDRVIHFPQWRAVDRQGHLEPVFLWHRFIYFFLFAYFSKLRIYSDVSELSA